MANRLIGLSGGTNHDYCSPVNRSEKWTVLATLILILGSNRFGCPVNVK